MHVVLIVAALFFAALAAFVVPDLLDAARAQARGELFMGLRMRLLMNDLVLYGGIALGCGFGAAVLMRLRRPTSSSVSPTTSPSRPAQRYAHERSLDAAFDPDRACDQCGQPASIINGRCRACGAVQRNNWGA